MISTRLDHQGLTDYVETVFPVNPAYKDQSLVKKVHDTVFELAESGDGSEMARGTLWGAYNAVTEYVDHFRNSKGNEAVRLKSMWFGSGEKIKKNAFREAVAMMVHGQLVRTGTYG